MLDGENHPDSQKDHSNHQKTVGDQQMIIG